MSPNTRATSASRCSCTRRASVPQFLFRPLPVHEEADFDAEIRHHLEHILVRFTTRAREKVDDAI